MTRDRSEAAKRGWTKRKRRIAARKAGADPEGWLRRPLQPSVSASEYIYLFGLYWRPEHLAALFSPLPEELEARRSASAAPAAADPPPGSAHS